MKKLKQKKEELEKLYGVDIKTVQPYKILKFFYVEIKQIQNLNLYTKKEQLTYINSIFKTKISYSTYIQFLYQYMRKSKTKDSSTGVKTGYECIVDAGIVKEEAVFDKENYDDFTIDNMRAKQAENKKGNTL